MYAYIGSCSLLPWTTSQQPAYCAPARRLTVHANCCGLNCRSLYLFCLLLQSSQLGALRMMLYIHGPRHSSCLGARADVRTPSIRPRRSMLMLAVIRYAPGEARTPDSFMPCCSRRPVPPQQHHGCLGSAAAHQLLRCNCSTNPKSSFGGRTFLKRL